jgi:hypothetical protein
MLPLFMPLLLILIAVLALSPTVYQLIRRSPLNQRQMWFYTAGYGLSLPLACYLAIPAWLMSSSSSWLGIIITASVTLYFPLTLLGLIRGWAAFRSHRSRLAAWMMILPAFDAVVFLIIALFYTFTSR